MRLEKYIDSERNYNNSLHITPDTMEIFTILNASKDKDYKV